MALIVVNPGTLHLRAPPRIRPRYGIAPHGANVLSWPPAACRRDRHFLSLAALYYTHANADRRRRRRSHRSLLAPAEFRAANPAVLARAIRIVGGVVALAIAAFTVFRGELAVAVPLGIFGAGLLGWSPFGMSGFPNIGGLFGIGQGSPGRASTVRSRYFEMTLDHDSGGLSGRIIAGPHVGHLLEEFDLQQLLQMIPELDADSVPLLESYLDRRFPAWRQNAQGDAAKASAGDNDGQEAPIRPEAGAGRDEIGPPCAHEETASR
jgi:hypothetical protein